MQKRPHLKHDRVVADEHCVIRIARHEETCACNPDEVRPRLQSRLGHHPHHSSSKCFRLLPQPCKPMSLLKSTPMSIPKAKLFSGLCRTIVQQKKCVVQHPIAQQQVLLCTDVSAGHHLHRACRPGLHLTSHRIQYASESVNWTRPRQAAAVLFLSWGLEDCWLGHRLGPCVGARGWHLTVWSEAMIAHVDERQQRGRVLRPTHSERPRRRHCKRPPCGTHREAHAVVFFSLCRLAGLPMWPEHCVRHAGPYWYDGKV